MSKPLVTTAPKIKAKRYVTYAQLATIYPFGDAWWRKQIRDGNLTDILKPSGRFGRVLVSLDAAHELMRSGMQQKESR